MNRNERRLAEKLGAHWVKIRHNGMAEICMGGEACGCVPAREDPQGAKRTRAAAQRPAEASLFKEPRYDVLPALPEQPVE
jgi:hypothetical protein